MTAALVTGLGARLLVIEISLTMTCFPASRHVLRGSARGRGARRLRIEPLPQRILSI